MEPTPPGTSNFTSRASLSGSTRKVKVWVLALYSKEPGKILPPLRLEFMSDSSIPVTTTEVPTLLNERFTLIGLSLVICGDSTLPTTPISPAPPL